VAVPRLGAAAGGGPLSLYSDPALYELVFSVRDVRAEVDALLAWRGRAGPPRQPATALELAAGPAAHAIEVARRGIGVSALDLSATMCAHARRRARQEGVTLEVVRADMTRFDLPGRFDLAFCMCDSAGHLHDLDQMVSHLRCVAAHLVAGGVYVLETSHPADFLGGVARTQDRWQVSRDGVRVDVRWTSGPVDPTTQIGDDRIRVRVDQGGRRRVVEGRLRLRRWTAVEVEAAVRLAGGLELVERHGSFDPDSRFDGGTGEWRMISVMRKISGGGGGRSRRR
jgi:SAM-dependent methyltransferase